MSITVYQPSATVLTGTWTPVIGGSGGTSGQAYTTQVGTYTRIGNLVVAAFFVTLSTEGTITGNVQIQGLPFAGSTPGQSIFTQDIMWNSLATTWVAIFARVGAGVSVANVVGTQAAANNSETALTATDIDDDSRFVGTLIYET